MTRPRWLDLPSDAVARQLRYRCSIVRSSQQTAERYPAQLPLVPAPSSPAPPEQPRAPHFRCELRRRSALVTRFASGGMAGAAGPAAVLAAAGAGRSPKPPAIVLSPEVVLHDRCNLVALPIVGGLVLAGLLGAVDTLLVRSWTGAGWGRLAGCCMFGMHFWRRLASFSGRAVQNRVLDFLLLTGHQGLHPVHSGRLFLHPARAQGRALSVRALAGWLALLHSFAALEAVPWLPLGAWSLSDAAHADNAFPLLPQAARHSVAPRRHLPAAANPAEAPIAGRVHLLRAWSGCLG